MGCARSNRGIVTIVCLMIMAILCALVVAYASMSTHSSLLSSNQAHIAKARLEAEGGLSFMLQHLQSTLLDPHTTQEALLDNLGQALSDRFEGTQILSGQPVQIVGESVVVPEIATTDGSFRCWFYSLGPDRLRLEVQGRYEQVYRTIAIDLSLVRRRSPVFDYGLASMGTVAMSGNARILGVNDPAEACVLSASPGPGNTIAIDGGVTVEGDLTVCGEDTQVSITGSPSIGGSTDPEVIDQHIHTGAEAPVFPAFDTAGLASLATNVVDGNSDLSTPDLVLSNVSIKAGTNPTFTSDVVLNGIVYVEAPNLVRFEGRTAFTGLLVTEQSQEPIGSCQIVFTGRVEAQGVEALPDTPEFQAVKEETGTFILAPGFGVTFAGNVSAVSGTIAADQLTFTGSAEGTIKGSLIGLKDLPTTLGGNVEVRVDSAQSDPDPAGFVQPLGLEPDVDSYRELTGG